MNKRVIDNLKPCLATVLLSGVLWLYTGPPTAMAAKENIVNATEKMVQGKETSGTQRAANTIETTVDEKFTVTLASNATTGYHWELAAPLDEKLLRLVSNTYQAPKSGLIGAGGQEIWTFRAIARGRTVIELKYVRPWEKEATPAETASYQVTVH